MQTVSLDEILGRNLARYESAIEDIDFVKDLVEGRQTLRLT